MDHIYFGDFIKNFKAKSPHISSRIEPRCGHFIQWLRMVDVLDRPCR